LIVENFYVEVLKIYGEKEVFEKAFFKKQLLQTNLVFCKHSKALKKTIKKNRNFNKTAIGIPSSSY
jgi:hypothetical protein